MIALLAWTALARKPEPEGPDLAALAAAQAEACARQVPENYRVHTGYASGPDATTAINAARNDAKRLALESLCAGKSQARCEVVSRHFEDWREPFFNPVESRACAHVAVNRQWIDDDRGDQQRLSSELLRLARDLSAALPDQSLVWVAPPLWSGSGCSVGAVGSSLAAELRNGIAAAGHLRLARERDAGSVLQTTLDLRGTEAVVSATLELPRSAALLPLTGFTIPSDLFDLATAGADCRLDRELGLTAGERHGADGRQVSLRMPVSDGGFCEGDQAEPVVVVDRPSRVKVFSVARSGEAYLVWPPPGQDGRVDGAVGLGVFDLVRTLDAGDEKLVAVAVGPGERMGAAEAWEAFCKAPGPLTSAAWPNSAALGAATYIVQTFDAPACLRRGVAQHPTALPPAVPACR